MQRIDKSDNRKELVGQASAVASQDIEPYTLIGPYAGMYVHIVDRKDIQSRSEISSPICPEATILVCIYTYMYTHTQTHNRHAAIPEEDAANSVQPITEEDTR